MGLAPVPGAVARGDARPANGRGKGGLHDGATNNMGIFSFIKDAGEKLLHRGGQANAAQAGGTGGAGASAQGGAAPAGTQAAASQPVDPQVANATAGKAIRDYIAASGLDASGLNVEFHGASATVKLEGQAPDQATREKIVLLAGNVSGVEQVDDRITVATQEAPAQMYTVKSGDTLSKIAQQFYGSASRYQAIFEANRPMLKDPDHIYPGQVLRIPADKA